jgi:hypothetical protein
VNEIWTWAKGHTFWFASLGYWYAFLLSICSCDNAFNPSDVRHVMRSLVIRRASRSSFVARLARTIRLSCIHTPSARAAWSAHHSCVAFVRRVHAFFMRSSCVLHAFFMRSSCVLHAFFMRSSCVLHAFFMRSSCVLHASRSCVAFCVALMRCAHALCSCVSALHSFVRHASNTNTVTGHSSTSTFHTTNLRTDSESV